MQIFYSYTTFNQQKYLFAMLNNHLVFLSTSETDFFSWFKNKKVTLNFEKNLDSQLVTKLLTNYFAKQLLTEFEAVTFLGTPFQIEVWKTLSTINWGETITYGMLAKKIQRSKSVRAVASAVGHNPLFLLVPCHRVIGIKDSLKFRLGPELKQSLLTQEQL